MVSGPCQHPVSGAESDPYSVTRRRESVSSSDGNRSQEDRRFYPRLRMLTAIRQLFEKQEKSGGTALSQWFHPIFFAKIYSEPWRALLIWEFPCPMRQRSWHVHCISKNRAITADGSIHFYRPVLPGDILAATINEQKSGRTISTILAEAYNENVQHLADAIFNMYCSRNNPAPWLPRRYIAPSKCMP